MPPRKRFDPLALFERTYSTWRGPYPSDNAELDATAARTKGMSMYLQERALVGDGELVDLLDRAFARGLSIVLSPDAAYRGTRGADMFHAFVLHHEELWRVPAYTALWRTAPAGWTDAAEAQASMLLGYTDAERAAWIGFLRWRQVAWGCRTIYTLISDEQRARVEELGGRTFGPASSFEDMTFFIHRSDHALKPTASKIVRSGVTLARVGLEHRLGAELLGLSTLRRGKPHSLVTGMATPSIARRFNRALRSSVQLLGPDGWST